MKVLDALTKKLSGIKEHSESTMKNSEDIKKSTEDIKARVGTVETELVNFIQSYRK
jgi:hypothetical protein